MSGIAEAGSHPADFRQSLRAAVRGLWMGLFSTTEFVDAFGSALDRYLRMAWDESAKKFGIEPDDYTDKDRMTFGDLLNAQYGFLLGFAKDIESGNKKNGGVLDPFLLRVDAWANRWNDVYNAGLVHFGTDEKLIWVVSPGKVHCDTCGSLNGWVKRASYWKEWSAETGISPQSHTLICRGYRCGCKWQPTQRPISKGRPPAIVE